MNYSKTDVGLQAFKERSPDLSARQRSVFILFDGVKSLDQVLTATVGLGVTQVDVDHLQARGYIAPTPSAVPGAVSAGTTAPGVDERMAQQRYAAAYPIATQLSASLGLRGFKLNLAVEAASGFDDLRALLPRLQYALNHEVCLPLERALRGEGS